MSLAFRIIALLLLAALFLPSGATEYDRLLVVAIDGASEKHIDVLIERDELPALAAMRSGGITAELSGGSARSEREFWARVLGVGEGPAGEPSVPVWDALESAGRRVVLVNVPVDLAGHADLAQAGFDGLPGADESRGFIGDSTGRVVDGAAVGRGRVEWPYREASREIVAAADPLQVGQATEWLDVKQPQPDGRSGRFRIYRFDEDAYYLTPVYRRTYDMPPVTITGGADRRGLESALYVADDASFTTASDRVLDYLLEHSSDLSRYRAEAARRLATGPWDVFVHYDSLLNAAYQVQASLLDPEEDGGEPTAADLVDQYRQVDAQIGRLLAAAGPGTLLVLVTREPRVLARDNDGTGMMLVGSDGSAVGESADESSVAATILDLAAVDLRPAPVGRPLHAVAARYRASNLPVTASRGENEPVKSFAGSAETLKRLGGLSASVSIPGPEDGDASTGTPGS